METGKPLNTGETVQTTPQQTPPTQSTDSSQSPAQNTNGPGGEPLNKTPKNPQEKSSKMKKALPVIFVALGLIILAVVVYFFYQNYKTKQEGAAATTSLPSPTIDPTANWETYTNITYDFIIKYPSEYSISGNLASSLETWKAGQGITITNQNSTAKPLVFIEAVFDGYGPFFPTGSMEVEILNNQLSIVLNKITDQEYQESINNGYIEEGTELFISKIIQHNGTPFSFRASHIERGNIYIEQELLQILSTFEFTN